MFVNNVKQSFAKVKTDMSVMKTKMDNQQKMLDQLFENQKDLLLRVREMEKKTGK